MEGKNSRYRSMRAVISILNPVRALRKESANLTEEGKKGTELHLKDQHPLSQHPPQAVLPSLRCCATAFVEFFLGVAIKTTSRQCMKTQSHLGFPWSTCVLFHFCFAWLSSASSTPFTHSSSLSELGTWREVSFEPPSVVGRAVVLTKGDRQGRHTHNA